jgi:hypothetical protein
MTRKRVYATVAAALLLLAVLDFWTRIFVPRHAEVRAASSFVPASVPPPASATAIRKDLVMWLPRLQPIADRPGAASNTDWSLRVLAVFDDRSGRFAVVSATPAAGGTAKVVRVNEGDELYGYKVTRIEALRVSLEGERGKQELQLFDPSRRPVGIPAPAGSTPAAVATPAPQPQASPPAAGPAGAQASTAPAASAGPKAVATQELKPGQAIELPESMRGLKVIDAPVPPPPEKKP